MSFAARSSALAPLVPLSVTDGAVSHLIAFSISGSTMSAIFSASSNMSSLFTSYSRRGCPEASVTAIFPESRLPSWSSPSGMSSLNAKTRFVPTISDLKSIRPSARSIGTPL